MDKSRKKITATCVLGVVALAVTCIGTYAFASSSDMTVSASVEEVENCLKVFVGDVNNAPGDYAQQRAVYIENTARADADELMSAIIGFDDYYTVEEITAWAEDYDIAINRAYMWPKGETGRLSLYVEDSDIEASIEIYKQEVERNGTREQDEQFAKDHQRFLDGEYEVFALTVTATAEALETLSAEADCVNYVDVMYNAEAETYAARQGKPVSYIELPSKPDGAL